MKVFISWSGNRSRAIAELLNDWIKCVIQATRPWMSSRDLERGALWFSEIADQLKDTAVGIVCLTQGNKNEPWILFESGALAKGLSTSRVCTFLIDLQPKDLEDPLAQFNHTLPDKNGVWSLVRTLNNCLATSALDDRILQQVFDTYWDQFKNKFDAILKDNPETQKSEPRSETDILAEILQTTRAMGSRVSKVEHFVEMTAYDNHQLRKRFGRGSESVHQLRQMISVGTPSDILIQFCSHNGIQPEILEREIERRRTLNSGGGEKAS